MSFDANASPRMIAWRDRLWGCDSVQSLLAAETDLHYPDVPALIGDTPATLPMLVLYREKFSLERSAPGESYEAAGSSMSAVLYFDPATHSVAQAEALAETICEELVSSEDADTLDVIRAECTRASNPAHSQDAAAADSDGRSYRTLAIVGWYA